MQEKDIAKLKFEKKPEECEHKLVVSVEELGAQDGYICLDCGARAQERSTLQKKRG